MLARIALPLLLALVASAAHAKVMVDWTAPGGGSIRPGNDTDACASTNSGAIRYSSGVLSYCNGSAWTSLAAGSATGTTAAAGVSGSIQFRDGSGALAGDTGFIVEPTANSKILRVGNNSNNAAVIELGANATANHFSYIDLVGDATYTDYGLRLVRDDTGPNARSSLISRGTGGLEIWAQDAAPIRFLTNSTERVRIDPDGKVGIGATNPSSSLVIGNVMYFNEGLGGVNTGPDIRFTASGLIASEGNFLLNYDSTNSGTGYFSVRKGANTGTGSTEVFQINNSGNVGIGTAATTAPLTFANTVVNTINENTSNDVIPNKMQLWGSAGATFGFGISTDDLDYFSRYNHRFYTGAAPAIRGTEAFTILANGNIGIGNVNPPVPLSFANVAITTASEGTGSDVMANKIRLFQNSAGLFGLGISDNDLDYFGHNHRFYVSSTATTRGTEALTILQDGKVGFGTSTPDVRVTVASGSGQLPVAVKVLPSTHATSRRAALSVDDWTWMQDLSASGTKNFGLWQSAISGPRLVMDTSGNLTIGNYTPSATLDVAGSNASGKSLLLRSGDLNTHSDSAQILFGYNNTANYTHSIRTRHSAGSAANNAIDFWLWTNADAAADLGSTRVMTLDGTGNVGIGTVTPTSKLTVEGAGVVANIGGTAGGILQVRQINGKSASSASSDVLFLNYGTGFNVNVGGGAGTSLLAVYGPGSTCVIGSGTGATNCTSDARLKKDIQPISGALEKLALIKGVTFHWKDPKKAEPERLGVLAQDVEKVFPQAVTTISDTTLPGGTAKAVDYAVLVAPLIEAVKELKAQNDALQADVEAIRADFAAYKAAHP